MSNTFIAQYSPSSRASCKICGSPIEMDALRIKHVKEITRDNVEVYECYHLRCWRVPPSIKSIKQIKVDELAPDDEDIVNNYIENHNKIGCCYCGKPWVQRTTQKPGPNFGRKFWTCAFSKCNFFAWCDGENKNTQESQGSVNKTTPTVNEVKCYCDVKAQIKIVRKEGANKGREFYCCGKYAGRCQFFMWVDDQPTTGPSDPGYTIVPKPVKNDVPSPTDSSSNVNIVINCYCGTPAVKRIVKKIGINKGRPFWCCERTGSTKCGFFAWADTDISISSPSPPKPNKPNDNTTIKCYCGLYARKRVVKKDSPNKGKEFWACDRMRCDFFDWVDSTGNKHFLILLI